MRLKTMLLEGFFWGKVPNQSQSLAPRKSPLLFTRISPFMIPNCHPLHLGIERFFLSFFGGGLNACPDSLGHLFREELSKLKWAYPCFWGGLNACPDGLEHLLREELSIPSEW